MTTTCFKRRHDPSVYRSGLEMDLAEALQGVADYRYEDKQDVIKYVKPARISRYTPDFVFPELNMVIETKGRFETADRQKHLLIKTQFPELDLRFVFSNSKQRISKKSQTTYGMWCEKNDFLFCDFKDKHIWLHQWIMRQD